MGQTLEIFQGEQNLAQNFRGVGGGRNQTLVRIYSPAPILFFF